MTALLRSVACALLAACTTVAGCATLLPKLEAPRLEVTAVALDGGSMQRQQVRLTLHATNPNNRTIAVRGIDCAVELAGMPFAQGATDASFTLPALGETDFDFNVTANLDTALAALAGSFGRSTVDYRIYGQVHLQSGMLRTIPFDEKGRVRLQ